MFIPTVKIAWLIGNEKYNNVRKSGKVNYQDLEQIPQDISKMTGFVQSLGFDKVIVSRDCNYRQINLDLA